LQIPRLGCDDAVAFIKITSFKSADHAATSGYFIPIFAILASFFLVGETIGGLQVALHFSPLYLRNSSLSSINYCQGQMGCSVNDLGLPNFQGQNAMLTCSPRTLTASSSKFFKRLNPL
jgi:hypothetical protein